MKCQVGYNLSNVSHGILTCGSNGIWQGTMGTCNGKNNPPNASEIVQRLQFANLKANLRPQETRLSTFCFLPRCHFFLVLEFFYFLKINSRQRVYYQPANRLSVLVEMGFKVARRRRGKKWNEFLSLHPPPPPHTSIFFASNFPNPSLTLYFLGMKKCTPSIAG